MVYTASGLPSSTRYRFGPYPWCKDGEKELAVQGRVNNPRCLPLKAALSPRGGRGEEGNFAIKPHPPPAAFLSVSSEAHSYIRSSYSYKLAQLIAFVSKTRETKRQGYRHTEIRKRKDSAAKCWKPAL
ncbi:hypothetical protein L209DRAFT_748270 [Thermothelomyces heterothallicus CBS 203.75]